MAKSLRSKRKRKMRAEKRERYGKKELERLKTMLEKAKSGEDTDVKFVTVESLKSDARDAIEVEEKDDKTNVAEFSGDKDLEPMEVVGEKKKGQKGRFPIWYSNHKIKKMKKRDMKNKMKKIKKAKQQKQKARRRH
ncbi:protein LLP homolog [Lycorma delicatula]|uniref:protein LLP homolog n=1 Tax=Lycorma delicatula TaxID=130591 RepID=UPI003F50FF7B